MQKNIFSNIKKYKNNVALYTKDNETIKYSQILRDIEVFKKYFKTKKIIIILAENSYEFIAAYISAIRNNQLIILVNPNINDNDLINLNKKYSPEYLFCNKKKNIPKNYKKILDFKNFILLKNYKKKNIL